MTTLYNHTYRQIVLKQKGLYYFAHASNWHRSAIKWNFNLQHHQINYTVISYIFKRWHINIIFETVRTSHEILIHNNVEYFIRMYVCGTYEHTQVIKSNTCLQPLCPFPNRWICVAGPWRCCDESVFVAVSVYTTVRH